MSQADESIQTFDLFKAMRERRDKLMADWATVTLGVTSSRPYNAVSSALMRPALLATAVSRKVTTEATAKLLAQLNLPSRQDVLALSQRLTRMEMVLDDISAGMDAAAAASAKAQLAQGQQRAASRERDGDGANRSKTAAKAG